MNVRIEFRGKVLAINFSNSFQKFLITALIFSIFFVMSSLSMPIDEQTSDENKTEVNVTDEAVIEPGEK